MMQQIYAKIRKSSKYHFQNDWARNEGTFPFPVSITSEPTVADYCVLGGPGGRYRLADVQLFVVENGRELKIT